MTTVEPVTARTPRPIRRALLTQHWTDVTFVHWPADPATIAPLLPRGVEPDTLGGVTYIGLIALRMRKAAFGLPHLGSFCETNVRLYSVDRHGRRAVVFLSLDAERLAFVLAARATVRLPYMWSRMRLERSGDVRTYSCRRRWPGRASDDLTVRVGEPLTDPSELEHFLTARWGLHAGASHLANEHDPWPLHRAELLHHSGSLLPAAGLPAPAVPPVSVLYSPGVKAKFGRTARPAPDRDSPAP